MSLMSMYYYMTDDSCSLKKGSLVALFFLYGLYLYLFFAFFIERYFKGNKNATFAGEKVDKSTFDGYNSTYRWSPLRYRVTCYQFRKSRWSFDVEKMQKTNNHN